MEKSYTVTYDTRTRTFSILFNGVEVAKDLGRAEATLMMEIFLRNIEEE